MDDAEARARIAQRTAADREPTLTELELDDLVAAARRPDPAGLVFEDDGYVPTWDLNFAIAEGWGMKASKVAGDFDYSDDAGSYSRQQVFEMCKRQEADYRKKILGSVPVSRHEPSSFVVVENA